MGMGSANVGGAVGKMTGSLSHCYVVGDVLGNSRTGVLAGYLDGGTQRVFGSFAIPITSGNLLAKELAILCCMLNYFVDQVQIIVLERTLHMLLLRTRRRNLFQGEGLNFRLQNINWHSRRVSNLKDNFNNETDPT